MIPCHHQPPHDECDVCAGAPTCRCYCAHQRKLEELDERIHEAYKLGIQVAKRKPPAREDATLADAVELAARHAEVFIGHPYTYVQHTWGWYVVNGEQEACLVCRTDLDRTERTALALLEGGRDLTWEQVAELAQVLAEQEVVA